MGQKIIAWAHLLLFLHTVLSICVGGVKVYKFIPSRLVEEYDFLGLVHSVIHTITVKIVYLCSRTPMWGK